MYPSPAKLTLAQVVIRQAARADLEALEWEGEFAHFRNMYLDTYHLAEAGRAIIWIAEKTEEGLIGQLFVSLIGGRPELADGETRAYVFGFRVRPAFRNLGVGTRMMQTVEDDLHERGFRMVTLNVARVNHSARRFYERLGYQVVADEPGVWSYRDQYGMRQEVHEPAWRMEKALPG